MSGILMSTLGNWKAAAAASGPTLVYDLDAANYSAVPANGSTVAGSIYTLTVSNTNSRISWNSANGGVFRSTYIGESRLAISSVPLRRCQPTWRRMGAMATHHYHRRHKSSCGHLIRIPQIHRYGEKLGNYTARGLRYKKRPQRRRRLRLRPTFLRLLRPPKPEIYA